MNSVVVNMLKDNTRTVIIIEGGATVEERDELAYQIAQAYLMPKHAAEKQLLETAAQIKAADNSSASGCEVSRSTIQDLEPVKIERPGMPTEAEVSKMAPYLTPKQIDTVVISFGKYKGMTPTAALRKDRERALVEFYKTISKDKTNPTEYAAILKACKSFMRNLPNEVDKLENKAQQMSFLRNCSVLIDMKGILGRYGFASMDAMERSATDKKIYEAVIYVSQAIARHGATK